MSADDSSATFPYRYSEQYSPPPAERVSEVAFSTFENVFEVDPRLMERWVLQQTFPNWDSLRLMNSRHDHLDWMHQHFADTVITGSEILAEVEMEEGPSTGSENVGGSGNVDPSTGSGNVGDESPQS